MSTEPMTPAETDLERIDGLLADLGTMNRRAAAQTLDEADWLTLARRMRRRLLDLRASLEEAAEPLVLTDAAEAVLVAGEVGRSPQLQALIRRMPALMTARQLAETPGVGSFRFRGSLAVVDGGRS